LRRCVLRALSDPAHPLRPGQIVLMTFDLSVAAEVKRALPGPEVCWLADSGAGAPRTTLEEIARAARGAGLDGIDVDAGWPMDAQIVQQIRGAAFKIYTWTIDDAHVARRLAAAGVDGITTNRPAELRAELGLP